MATDAAQRLMGKFIDQDSVQPVDEDGGVSIAFQSEAIPDQLLTDGGEIEKKHPKVREIRKLEAEALALIRAENPFTEEEPQPPAKDALPATVRAYQEGHQEWDARRLQHESDLKERATLLREHHEVPSLYVVSPAGRPIYTDVDCIRIVIPGDKDNIVDRPIRPSDIERYREKYNRFKAGQSQVSSGTPLNMLPGITASQVKELAYFEVRTIENLASVNDANLSKIGTYTALRQKARDWLAAARGAAPIEEARAEAARAREEMAAMRREIAELREAQSHKGQQLRK